MFICFAFPSSHCLSFKLRIYAKSNWCERLMWHKNTRKDSQWVWGRFIKTINRSPRDGLTSQSSQSIQRLILSKTIVLLHWLPNSKQNVLAKSKQWDTEETVLTSLIQYQLAMHLQWDPSLPTTVKIQDLGFLLWRRICLNGESFRFNLNTTVERGTWLLRHTLFPTTTCQQRGGDLG